MRLGDLNSLKEKLSDKNYITYTHEYGDAIPVEWVMNAIDNTPTIIWCSETSDGLPLMDLRPRLQGEWIPVSERLPEENGEYLVTREAYIDRENRNMIFVRDIAWFTTNYELNNGFHKANTVIAWMPLPELYEEEGAKE